MKEDLSAITSFYPSCLELSHISRQMSSGTGDATLRPLRVKATCSLCLMMVQIAKILGTRVGTMEDPAVTHLEIMEQTSTIPGAGACPGTIKPGPSL
jgi:hypothetical protein